MKAGITILLSYLVITAYSTNSINPLPRYLQKSPHTSQDPFNIPTDDLQIKTYHLHYQSTQYLKQLITQNHLLRKNDTLIGDDQHHLLWIKANQSTQRTIAQLIHVIDQPTQQVKIKAKIVDINTDYLKDIGINFGTKPQVISDGKQFSTLMPSSFNTGSFNFAIGKIGNNALLWLQLTALEKEGHGEVIASPILLTENHHRADIESGSEIPYQEHTGEGNTTTTFKKAVLRLSVTPTIKNKNAVSLKITMNQDKVSPLTIAGVPAINTHQINTEVLVHNQQTIVLGGILERNQAKITERVPFLSAIPILGKLFTHQTTEHNESELLIFITPKIVP